MPVAVSMPIPHFSITEITPIPQFVTTAAPAGTIVTGIAGQIIKTGRVTNPRRAALGVQVQTVTDPSGWPTGAGIAAVTPAAKAGLRACGPARASTDGSRPRSGRRPRPVVTPIY
ncbi:MAG TPA: hypothetical protein VFJ07_18580 [Streptosporangiaceae bacterium]|nr:hypothetical protein [Streptosporangiaceae bacterium]